MVQTWTHGIDNTHRIDLDLLYSHVIIKDSWYRNGLMVQTWTHGIDEDSWYRHGLMVQTWTHGIDEDSWYRPGLTVFTTPMVFTQAPGIESVLVNYTRKRGPTQGPEGQYKEPNITF